MKILLLFLTTALFTGLSSMAQIKNARTETVKVYGNCEMCEAGIEKAAGKNKISKAVWNKDSKMATITYNGRSTTLDAVLKNIALAGYDNEKFLAPEAAYNKLPDCCKYERSLKITAKVPSKEPGIAVSKPPVKQQATEATAPNQAAIFKPVLDDYFAVKDALVKTDGNKASVNAASLLKALETVKMESLKTDVHMEWMKVEKDLKMAAKDIADTKDAAKQRKIFMSLSKNIYSLVKITRPAEKIFFQHCPMYNGGNGADWLSKESAIKNPYYGSMMLSCGSTVETIE